MNPSSEPQAFGAGRAGSTFDPIEFIKKPQVILRVVAWVYNSYFKKIIFFFINVFQQVFAIIVFASIAQEGYVEGVCRYNGSNACGYGVGIGVISFLLTIAFTALDVYFPNISNIKQRKFVVLGELAASGKYNIIF